MCHREWEREKEIERKKGKRRGLKGIDSISENKMRKGNIQR